MLTLAAIALTFLLASPETTPEPTPESSSAVPETPAVAAAPVCTLLESRPDRAACGISDADQLIFGCPDDPEMAFHYTPEKTSQHTVKTKILRCAGKECRMDSGTAVFADDPAQYFDVEPGLSVRKAVQVARLFQAGRLSRPGFPRRALQQLMDMRIVRIAPLSTGYELELVTCGCESKIQVGIASESGRDLLQIRNRNLDAPCS